MDTANTKSWTSCPKIAAKDILLFRVVIATHPNHADGVVPVGGEPSKGRYGLPGRVEVGARGHHQHERLRYALLPHHLHFCVIASVSLPLSVAHFVCAALVARDSPCTRHNFSVCVVRLIS